MGTETQIVCDRVSSVYDRAYAELYKYADANKTIIDTADVFHALQDLTEGLSLGWTFAAGVRGTDITLQETQDAGAATLMTTTADHNLSVGDFVTITGTTNYNGPGEILTVPTSTTFKINLPFVADDATGTYSRGDSFHCDSGYGGIYNFEWSVTTEPDAANKALTGAIMINDSVCNKCRSRDYFSKSEYESAGSGSLIDISAGDSVSIVMKNITDAVDMTIRHGNFRIFKV